MNERLSKEREAEIRRILNMTPSSRSQADTDRPWIRICSELLAEIDALRDENQKLRERMKAVYEEWDQIYDGPESRIPGSLTQVIVEMQMALAELPKGPTP